MYVEKRKEEKDLIAFIIILITVGYQFDEAVKDADAIVKYQHVLQKWRSINVTALGISEIPSVLLCTVRYTSSREMNVSQKRLLGRLYIKHVLRIYIKTIYYNWSS